MDWFPLNYRSRKVIIKMHREGKDCSSSQKNGLFQLNLKPRQILMCCQNSHEDHSEKLVKCTTTSPHIINWGWKTRTEEWKIWLMKLRLDGRSLFVTVPDCRNIWVSLPLKTDCRGRQHILFASARFGFFPLKKMVLGNLKQLSNCTAGRGNICWHGFVLMHMTGSWGNLQ